MLIFRRQKYLLQRNQLPNKPNEFLEVQLTNSEFLTISIIHLKKYKVISYEN